MEELRWMAGVWWDWAAGVGWKEWEGGGGAMETLWKAAWKPLVDILVASHSGELG